MNNLTYICRVCYVTQYNSVQCKMIKRWQRLADTWRHIKMLKLMIRKPGVTAIQHFGDYLSFQFKGEHLTWSVHLCKHLNGCYGQVISTFLYKHIKECYGPVVNSCFIFRSSMVKTSAQRLANMTNYFSSSLPPLQANSWLVPQTRSWLLLEISLPTLYLLHLSIHC